MYNAHNAIIILAISGFVFGKVYCFSHFLVISCLVRGVQKSLQHSHHIYLKESSSVFLPSRPSESLSFLPALPILPGYELREGLEQKMGCSYLRRLA